MSHPPDAAAPVGMMTTLVGLAAPKSRLRRFRASLGQMPTSLRIGATLVFFFILVALTGPAWAPYSAVDTTAAGPLAHPSPAHFFGTDLLGRDVFSRVIDGTREVIFLSFAGSFAAALVGGGLGLLAGYVRGWFDEIVMRAVEALVSIPFLLVALLLITAAGAVQGGSYPILIAVVVLFSAPRVARSARAIALDLSTRDFVTIARARGERSWSIVGRELAPNAAGVLLVEFGVRMSTAPLLISSLGFLGFGARPPSPEWGLMISENRSALVSTPVSVLAPCAALALLVIGLNLLTDGIARMIGRSTARTP